MTLKYGISTAVFLSQLVENVVNTRLSMRKINTVIYRENRYHFKIPWYTFLVIPPSTMTYPRASSFSSHQERGLTQEHGCCVSCKWICWSWIIHVRSADRHNKPVLVNRSRPRTQMRPDPCLCLLRYDAGFNEELRSSELSISALL